jgi:hypothetical protein
MKKTIILTLMTAIILLVGCIQYSKEDLIDTIGKAYYNNTSRVINYENSPFGFHPAQINGDYGNAQDIGVRWERGKGSDIANIIIWYLIQPDANINSYKFKNALDKRGNPINYDEIYSVSSGLKHVLNFENDDPMEIYPEERFVWINERGNRHITWEPKNINNFSNYIKKVVERYDGDNDYGCIVSAPDCYISGDGEYPAAGTIAALQQNPIKYWQVANEPNWLTSGVSGFSVFMGAAYKAIKIADPTAIVLIGGVPGSPYDYLHGFVGFDNGHKIFIEELSGRCTAFCADLKYGNCNNGCIDVFDFHWYGNATGDYRLKDSKTGEDVYNYIKNTLAQNSYNIPIWITELSSYNGCPSTLSTTCQSEMQQAMDYVKRHVYPISRGVKRIFVAFDMLEGFLHNNDYFDHTPLIYDGEDFGFGTDPMSGGDPGYGIKKLSYYSYKLMTEKLEGSNWTNIQEVYAGGNVYAYKLMNTVTGKPVFVAWWDYWNEPSLKTKQVTLNLNGISATRAKITEAVPKYETGQEVTNYASAFSSGVNSLSRSYTLTITLGKSPVYIEGTTAQISNYVPNSWSDVVPTGKSK